MLGVAMKLASAWAAEELPKRTKVRVALHDAAIFRVMRPPLWGQEDFIRIKDYDSRRLGIEIVTFKGEDKFLLLRRSQERNLRYPWDARDSSNRASSSAFEINKQVRVPPHLDLSDRKIKLLQFFL